MSLNLLDLKEYFRKKLIWGVFYVLDWLKNIDTKEKVADVIEMFIKTTSFNLELYNSDKLKRIKLLEKGKLDYEEYNDKLNENKLDLELTEKALFYSSILDEVDKKTTFDQALENFFNNFNVDEHIKFLKALEEVKQEAQEGKFGHDLVNAMKRVEELTDFEAF